MTLERDVEKGDVIQFEYDDEKLTLSLETEHMAKFVNSTVEFEKEWLEDFAEIKRRKIVLDTMTTTIRNAAKQQAMIDSIVQHCLTGK